MNIETTLQQAEQLLAPWRTEGTHPETKRLDVVIASSSLRHAVTALQEAHWGYL